MSITKALSYIGDALFWLVSMAIVLVVCAVAGVSFVALVAMLTGAFA